jgi:CO/xanthine dehydrogenase Mo-binding subunit
MNKITPEIVGGVGDSPNKVELKKKLLGQAKYIDDLYRPNMLHGAILPSPHAHAKIISYNVEAARALPGVKCVITGDNFGDNFMGPFIKDEGAIAKGKVRYIGEPVCAVAATTTKIAKTALGLIDVKYEVLTPVLSMGEAIAEDAPIIHEGLKEYTKIFESVSYENVMSETKLSEGDVDNAWAECDLIVENVYETQAQNHMAIETCGALAEEDGNGRIELWSANQSVFRVQANVCESLGLPMSKLRCLTPTIGGGFGNKMEAHVQPIVVKLTMETGLPVKIILSREEDFEMIRARHPFRIWIKTGVKNDGSFVARDVDILMDGGAFSDDSPGVLGYSVLCSRGPYRIPNMRSVGRVVYTNHLRFAAFRGFGNPQVNFASEAQIDEIADKLGVDAIEIRQKNAIEAGDTWFGGQVIGSSGLKECLAKAKLASNWDAKRKNIKSDHNYKRRGLGIAVCGHISGLLGTGAIIRLLEDGTVALNTGATDIGQGSDTVLSQMAAEALKVPLENISLAQPDTDGSPFNWGTTASRVTDTTGRAVVGAAKEVENQVKKAASQMLECSEDDLELVPGGKVGLKGVPGHEVSFFDISKFTHWGVGGPIVGSHTLVYENPSIDPKRAVASGTPFSNIGAYSFNATVVEVEVDERTGSCEVLEVWSATDVGRAINPALVEGQIEGGFVQGLGYALFEEMIWDNGRLANPNLMDYKVPGSMDVPYDIHSIIVEHPEPDGPFGAKGVGEVCIVAVPGSIANAILHAADVKMRKLPMSSERVFDALRDKEENNAT